MKKLLSLIAIFTLTLTATNPIIACSRPTSNKKTNLKTIIKFKDLNDIIITDTKPTKPELLAGIKAKNPTTTSSLTENDFDFETNPSATDATIIGKGNYTGKVPLTYSKQIIKLETLFTKKDLDQIVMSGTKPTKTELLAGIKAKNAKAVLLTKNDFNFETNPSATDAIIIGKGNYTGKVPLTYTRETDLEKYIVDKDLNQIVMSSTKPTKAELLAGIIVKNPTTTISLTKNDFDFETNPSATDATIIGKGNYTGKVSLAYTRETDLEKYIVDKDLNQIVMYNTIPTKAELLAGIKAKNPTTINLTENDFNFETNPSATDATIIGKGKYTGKVPLTYYSQQKTDLNNLFTEKDLEGITISQTTPTKDELLAGIKAKNPTTTSLTKNDFDFDTNPSATDATIIGKGNYTGKVPLTYYPKQKTDLNNLFTEKDLEGITISGTIPTKPELLAGIKAKNPTTTSSLTENDFDFETFPFPTSADATITGKGNYTGKVDLIYYPNRKTNLKTILKLTGLNLIAKPNESFQKLEGEIGTKADQFKVKPINNLFEITHFYDSPTSTVDLRLKNQAKGNFWIIIKVTYKEPNWARQTLRLEITLN